MSCDTHIACLVCVVRGTMCGHVWVCISFRKHVYIYVIWKYRCFGMWVSVVLVDLDESRGLYEDCLVLLTLKTKALRSFEASGTTRQKWQLKECHPRCVYQNYNGLIINNVSQKHNYICKYNNLRTTCFGLIRPSSGWKYSVRGKLSVWSKCRCAGEGKRSRLQPLAPYL